MSTSLKLAGDTFVAYQPLEPLIQQIDPSVSFTIRAYRQALEGYQKSIPATEGGTRRKLEAIQVQQDAIVKAVEEGLSPEAIFAKVGDVTYMDNVFAKNVTDAYRARAFRAQEALLNALRANSEKIATHLDNGVPEHVDVDGIREIVGL